MDLSADGKVWIVQHEAPGEGDDLDDSPADTKFIGVFTSSEILERVIAHLREQPGFREAPDGFSVDTYRLNEGHWMDGYETRDG